MIKTSNKNPGLLVVVEGIDGTGKSTLCKVLVSKLEANKEPTLSVREPGGSSVGKKIRTLLLEDANANFVPNAEMLLFAADRAQLYEEQIVPALQQGKIIISDRSWLSSLMYQGYGKGVNKQMIKLVNAWACNHIEPDLIVLLDLDVAKARARLAQSRANPDSFEKLSDNFFDLLRTAFQTELCNKKNVLTLDANLPTEELCKEILTKIESLKREKSCSQAMQALI